ncbi:1-acyl-sn-glycerol-3-phosphate acyltransferase 1, chloroplastic isoform X1, partial [Tanacetum coccineum]
AIASTGASLVVMDSCDAQMVFRTALSLVKESRRVYLDAFSTHKKGSSARRNFKFVSKTAIFLYHVVGWAMFLMDTIPLKRMDRKSQLNGGSVFFFPEGTRSRDGRLGAFKKGAFSISAKTGVPVVPITLIRTGKIMPTGMEGLLNPGMVKVVIHQPIKGDDADILCTEARNVIADELSRQG